ncbi:MAG: helix-turn-helix domain-containing protein, partial [Natronosporangium sp.]
AALAGKASAHAAAGQPEHAAAAAQVALPVARRAGSRRVIAQVERLGQQLAPHRSLPAVADLLEDLSLAA